MVAIARAWMLGVLAASACGDDPGGYVFEIDVAGVQYAAWQDGDGPWQAAELSTELRVTAERHTVAIAAGATVAWDVDLFDLGDAPGPTRAGVDGTLTW